MIRVFMLGAACSHLARNTMITLHVLYYTSTLTHIGLRVDGRRPPELRKLQCRLGVFRQADGSAFLEQGNTKVLATVYGPHDV